METNENTKNTHRDFDEDDSKEYFREEAGVYSSSAAQQQQQQQQQQQNQNQARTFTNVFDLVDRYAQTRISHEEKTREAMMSIAQARYSLGSVGWEAVANDAEAKKTTAKCCVAVAKVTSSSDDDDVEIDGKRNAFRAVFITDDEEEEKEGEEEDEQTQRSKGRRRLKPVYQARAVIEKFRELTKASAEVLSLKSALGREVERYERQYLAAEAAAAATKR